VAEKNRPAALRPGNLHRDRAAVAPVHLHLPMVSHPAGPLPSPPTRPPGPHLGAATSAPRPRCSGAAGGGPLPGRQSRNVVYLAGRSGSGDSPNAGSALLVDGEFVAAGRHGTAGFWCPSYTGLLLPMSHCLRCSGGLAVSCPRQGEILSLAVSCCWRQSQRGGSRAPVSEPARPGEPGPGSRRPQRAAGQRARCRRGQPGKRAL